jgi:hypothetical protein
VFERIPHLFLSMGPGTGVHVNRWDINGQLIEELSDGIHRINAHPASGCDDGKGPCGQDGSQSQERTAQVGHEPGGVFSQWTRQALDGMTLGHVEPIQVLPSDLFQERAQRDRAL